MLSMIGRLFFKGTTSEETVTSVTKTDLPDFPRKDTPAKCSHGSLKQPTSSSSGQSAPVRSSSSLKAKVPPKRNSTKAVVTEKRAKTTQQRTVASFLS